MLDDNYSDEVSNISIDEMERMLKNAREKGATHVGIFYHSDHMEYEVYGYKHELADEAYLERKAEEARVTEELRKHAAILKLKKQATELGLDITIN